jgi:Tat protein secretion system quality control protein TatD with DNase activity
MGSASASLKTELKPDPGQLWHADGLFATVGCHPCRAYELDEYEGGAQAYIEALAQLIEANIGDNGRVMAGERIVLHWPVIVPNSY